MIIDVGGGRGDLGLALAKTFPDHQVLVYEPNRPSLNQGKTRATELGFSNIHFKCNTLESLVCELKAKKIGQGKKPLLVSLHACGGLSDAVLEVCGTFGLTFCLCTCCFASFPHLRPKDICPADDYRFLSRIAETNEIDDNTRYCATRIINSLRVQTFLGTNWNIQLYRFPKEWSGRNFVIRGQNEFNGDDEMKFARPKKKLKVNNKAIMYHM